MIPDIRRVQSSLENAITDAVNQAEKDIAKLSYKKAQAKLNDLTDSWTVKATKDYHALGDYLLVKYLDGNIKHEKDGEFERTPEGMAVQPTFGGYNDRYFRSIVNEQGDRLRVVDINKK
jgi:hypothetical protein